MPSDPTASSRSADVLGPVLLGDESDEDRARLARITLDACAPPSGLLDAKGIVLDLNRAALRSADVPLEAAVGRPLIALPWWTAERGDAEDAERSRIADALDAAARGERVALDARVTASDGARVLALTLVPVVDAGGAVAHIAFEGRDVTAQRADARERTRRRDEQLYEAILGNTPDLAYVFNRDHRFIYANEGLLRMWGKTLDEAIGRNCLELGYEPWHAAMHDREIEEVIATRAPIRGEVPFTGTFGRRIYDYIFVPVLGEDGSVVAVAGTTRDITEVREAQESLQVNVERHEALLRSAPFGVLLVDADLRINEANPVVRPMIGDVPDGPVGWGLGELVARLFPPAAGAQVLQAFAHTLATGEPFVASEFAVERLDRGGRVEHYDWRVLRIPLPGGGHGVACYVQDVSDQVRARQATEAARQSAEDAARSREEFLSIASHELRNPVAVLSGTAQQLRRAHANGRLTEDRLAAYIDALERSGAHLATLTNDLLDVSRLQRGELPLRLEPADVASLVRDVVRHGEWADRRLTFEIDDRPRNVLLDPNRLRQVLANLLDNAVKYSPAGGDVHVRLREEDGGILLEVRDSGIGLPPDALESIFTPFSRAANAARENIPGLGLGLYVARRIAEQHGGRLWADSAGEGAGTTMSLWLPLSPVGAVPA
ncbi:MAG: PAS domain-containing protein [Dehalococcoidia bacterium]